MHTSSAQNLAAEPVLISEKTVHSSNGSVVANDHNHNSSEPELSRSSQSEADAGERGEKTQASGPVAFLSQKFASFNVLHSPWRNRHDTTLESQKGVSKSLEDLQDKEEHPAKKSSKPKPPRPPPANFKNRSASAPATEEHDDDDEVIVVTSPGYEDIEIRRKVKHKRVPVAHSSGAGDGKSSSGDLVSRKTPPTSSGGGMKRYMLSSSAPTRTGPESEDIVPVESATPHDSDSPSGDELSNSKPHLPVKAPRIELAYDQVIPSAEQLLS